MADVNLLNLVTDKSRFSLLLDMSYAKSVTHIVKQTEKMYKVKFITKRITDDGIVVLYDCHDIKNDVYHGVVAIDPNAKQFGPLVNMKNARRADNCRRATLLLHNVMYNNEIKQKNGR